MTVQSKKTVAVVSRNEFTTGDRVVFTVLSSDRKRTYETTLVGGKCVKCTCPARPGACYHGSQLELIEAARREAYRLRDYILSEYALMKAEKELAERTAQKDKPAISEPDPWFGFTAQERFNAWRAFEMSMAGLAD